MAEVQDKNIVEFGLSEVHIGTYEVGPTGTVTLGQAYKVPGAVELGLDPSTETSEFMADNVKYYVDYQDNGFEGSLEMARFTDEFKVKFLGYTKLTDGGIALLKGAKKPKVYIAFQGEGDAQSRRCILYNVALSSIKAKHKTVEKGKDPQTQSIDITVTGDNATGIVRADYVPEAAGYKTIFSAPPKPVLPTI